MIRTLIAKILVRETASFIEIDEVYSDGSFITRIIHRKDQYLF
jgi:hypothetical protein